MVEGMGRGKAVEPMERMSSTVYRRFAMSDDSHHLVSEGDFFLDNHAQIVSGDKTECPAQIPGYIGETLHHLGDSQQPDQLIWSVLSSRCI
jgi:hypothetical protein